MYDNFLPMLGQHVLTVELHHTNRPVQWERGTPSRGKGRGFIVTTKKQRNAQNELRELFLDYLRAWPEDEEYFPWGGAVRLHVHSFYPIPKSDCLKDFFRISEKTGPPDVSNLLKQPEDAFNQKKDDFGVKIALRPYLDDAHITQAYTTKHNHPYLTGQIIVIELWTNPTLEVPWDALSDTFGSPRNLWLWNKNQTK